MRLLAPLSFPLLALSACQVSPGTAAAQEDVPPGAIEALTAKYPTAEDVRWGRDRNDSHEAHFRFEGRKLRADYTESGAWIETEESIDYGELPAAVREAIEAEYDAHDIVELEHTDNAVKGDFYDVELDPKGEKKFDVEYRADGSKL